MAVSNIIAIILILVLVVILASIALAILSGQLNPVEKTAYVASEAEFVNLSPGIQGIRVLHKGGDVMYYEESNPDAAYEVKFMVQTKEQVSPVQTDQSFMSPDTTWSPGDSIILFRTDNGYFLTNDPTQISGALAIPNEPVTLRIIDNTNGQLIAVRSLGKPGGTDTQYTITATAGPGGAIAPSGEVPVPLGVSRSFIITADTGFLIDDVVVDGTSLSGPLMSPYTYSFPAVDADHTIDARFISEAPGLSVEAWVKWNRVPTSASDEEWATIVVDGERDSGTRQTRYHLQHNQGNTAFEIAMRADTRVHVQSSTTPVADQWYYLAGVYDQNMQRLQIYVNGVLENSKALSGAIIPSPGRYQVGGLAGIEWPGPTSMRRKFDGEIRGIGIHERAFTPAEVRTRYEAGVP